ncbi:MAG: hypothetical protein LBQ69_01275 [Treponema sp.]|jgi:hypothetical protein|nr:hypothetical protein [Treponema sp.]
MQHAVSLNDLYADFSAGLLGKKDLEEAVFKTISKNIRYLPGLRRQDYEDYISWLYPRIRRAITAYRETGSSFESYIGAMVRLTAKEYRQRQMHDYTTEFTAWLTQLPGLFTCESEPEFDEGPPMVPETAPKELAMPKNPRQLLILVLKCCNYVSADFLERVSPVLGMEPKTLGEMIDCLRAQRAKREREICLLRERANCQFFRCILYERTLQFMSKDSAGAQRLKGRLERGRKRLAKIRKRLAKLRPDPSNHQIAEVLGIAKGTVDAALHALKAQDLKTRWGSAQERHMLN